MKPPKQIFCALFISALVLLNSVTLSAAGIRKGFDALSVYNYFEAKKIFSSANKHTVNPFASFGLATIFMRRDNPFYNLDSAVKYVNLSYNSYLKTNAPAVFPGYYVDDRAILQLADSISLRCLRETKLKNTVAALDAFLQKNYLCSKKYTREAVFLRDELEFNKTMQSSHSDSSLHFIVTHPQSAFLPEAKTLMERQIYEECTADKKAESYVLFLKKYPVNGMRNNAYDQLFSIYRDQKDVKGLSQFVENYPKAPPTMEAWKLLFSLSVKVYSYTELKNFLEVYPKFPLKNSILKELDLNKKVLIPCQKGDYSGYIDQKGKFVIKPVYDEATEFYEGLAVVTREDSVFFINKENENPFNLYFSDAAVFKNGIAPVKWNKKWSFINRQGQNISDYYDEIREFSGGLYVVRMGDKYGALDQYGQIVLEPRFEKLGDFHNDHAYFSESSLFGFVSRNGFVYKAEFEWISTFDEDYLAVIKKNGRYGLINAQGKVMLDPTYDLILKAENGIFILVADNLYGFFSREDCFITSVMYEFMREKPADYYTNGRVLKLQKKGEQALIDLNGRYHVNFGVYEAISYPGNGLLMVKRKNRYGYVDTKLEPVIPYKYQDAGDFEDSLALVKLADKKILIDLKGNELFSSDDVIKKISKRFYFVENGEGQIINNKGLVECTGVEHFKVHPKGMIVVTLSTGEIKLIYD